MWLLIAGLIVFFIPHMTRMLVPGLRDTGVARFGEGGWKGLYSLVSLIGLLLIIFGWRAYRLDAPDIYIPPDWGSHVTELFVPIALILNFAAYMPTGRIKATVQHPFLLAVMFWSVGHLFANGDLASLIMFGSFVIYAVWNRIAVSMRGTPPAQFESYRGDIGAIAIGIIVSAVIVIWLHVYIAGVPLF